MRFFLTLLAASTLLPRAATAQEPKKVTYESFRLANGLDVLLAPDHSTQVVAVDIVYGTGSRNEQKGRTGFAHLFEHMMFQGSENVVKGGHFQQVVNAGGIMNGFTTEDRTEYFNILPSNRVNLALWLEADRMRSLAVTADNFANQQQAVKEELRLKVDNAPYANALLTGFSALADPKTCFAYAHPAIGSIADLNAAQLPDVQAFFNTYYTPNNATLVVAGDFDPAVTKSLIEQYFGSIKRGKAVPAVKCVQSFNTGEVRRSVPDAHATLPAVYHMYRIPAPGHADYPAIVLLGEIMGTGPNSRLNRALVRDSKVALGAGANLNTSISASTNRASPRSGFGVMTFIGIVSPAVSPDTAEAKLAAQVRLVAANGVTEAEVEGAKAGYRSAFITNRQQPIYVAEDIQLAKRFLGGPEAVNTDLHRYMRVTAKDIKRVAAKYFRADNSVVTTAIPGKK